MGLTWTLWWKALSIATSFCKALINFVGKNKTKIYNIYDQVGIKLLNWDVASAASKNYKITVKAL